MALSSTKNSSISLKSQIHQAIEAEGYGSPEELLVPLLRVPGNVEEHSLTLNGVRTKLLKIVELLAHEKGKEIPLLAREKIFFLLDHIGEGKLVDEEVKKGKKARKLPPRITRAPENIRTIANSHPQSRNHKPVSPPIKHEIDPQVQEAKRLRRQRLLNFMHLDQALTKEKIHEIFLKEGKDISIYEIVNDLTVLMGRDLIASKGDGYVRVNS